MIVATSVALAVSVVRKRAGVSGHRAEHDRRTERVAAMTGIDRSVDADDGTSAVDRGPEFPPGLDLVAPLIGVVGLVAAGVAAGGPAPLAIARTVVGAAFLGVVTDAMLLGHWYLVQPGLSRGPLNELVRWLEGIWPVELVVLIWPVGMLSVLSGTVDDGWNGTLGWMWVACALTTIGLAIATQAALQRAAVLGRDGCDGPALPGDPHRLRHGSRRPRRPCGLTGRAETARVETAQKCTTVVTAESVQAGVVAGKLGTCRARSGAGPSASGWSPSRSSCTTPCRARRVVQPDRHAQRQPHQDEEGLGRTTAARCPTRRS